jgi:hypothetical protein
MMRNTGRDRALVGAHPGLLVVILFLCRWGFGFGLRQPARHRFLHRRRGLEQHLASGVDRSVGLVLLEPAEHHLPLQRHARLARRQQVDDLGHLLARQFLERDPGIGVEEQPERAAVLKRNVGLALEGIGRFFVVGHEAPRAAARLGWLGW